MFVLSATKVLLSVDQSEVVTSGSVNVNQVQFIFDEAWDGLERTAVFQAGDESASVLLDDTGICVIPWEVLQDARRTLYAGVYGTKNGNVVLPTIWGNLGEIRRGVTPGDSTQPPTPSVYEQILSLANEAKEISQEALTTAEDAKGGASGSAAAAQESAEAAEKAASAAESAAQSAGSAAGSAVDAAAAAEESAKQAAGSAQEAQTAQGKAESAAGAAEKSAQAAQSSESGASKSATAAETAASAAQTSESNSKKSETAAAGSATAAGDSATAAGKIAQDAAGSASAAQASAGQAAQSAADAASSASAAQTAAEQAQTAAIGVTQARDEAVAAQGAAETAQDEAQQAAIDAADAKADVDAALEDAQEAATGAAASAQTAATAATNAETAKTAIENMTVSAETLGAGQDVTVEKKENEDGTVNLNFGIPQGPPGQDGVQIDDDTVSETATWSSAKISEAIKPNLEEQIAAYYTMRRTGKVYQTKVWKFAANPTSAGEKLRDNAGLVFEPSTDTVEGQDDYLDGSNPLFEWVNVNYVRDADGSPRPTAIEGMESFATTGAVDVGVMQMSFWFDVDSSDPEYIIYTISDTPHPELGLEPWPECVTGDGSVLPWCIASKYISGIASDGVLRSQPGLVPERMMSYQYMLTEYQKKGEGYWGAGVVRNTFQIVFNAIKGATKSSQVLFAGTTTYSFQYSASVERATDETYFPVTNAQAANVVVGSRVSVGYGAIANDALSNDRGYATMHSYADSAKVLKIEPLDDANMAVYLDTETGFDTTPVVLSDTISAPITMSSMHWESGTTDAVLGHHDGSVVSNTNGKYPYRVQGREYAVGAYVVASDTVAWLNEDGTRDIYTAKRGDPHISSGNDAIKAAYKLVGTIPVKEGSETAADYWIGDIAVDLETGASLVSAQGASNTQGVGDYYYAGGTGYNTFREYPTGGNLWYGSLAGASLVYLGLALGTRVWDSVAGD